MWLFLLWSYEKRAELLIENHIVLRRSDIAWKDAKYAQIWEYLRDEFELTQRFATLDIKLKFVEVTYHFHSLFGECDGSGVCVMVTLHFYFLQHNIRFLQEILQNRKSDFLEWFIIILICTEILISIYDISHKYVIPL